MVVAVDKRYLAERVLDTEDFLEKHEELFAGNALHRDCTLRILETILKLCGQKEGVKELADELRRQRDENTGH